MLFLNNLNDYNYNHVVITYLVTHKHRLFTHPTDTQHHKPPCESVEYICSPSTLVLASHSWPASVLHLWCAVTIAITAATCHFSSPQHPLWSWRKRRRRRCLKWYNINKSPTRKCGNGDAGETRSSKCVSAWHFVENVFWKGYSGIPVKRSCQLQWFSCACLSRTGLG